MTITNHKHAFKIEDQEIELLINYDGTWWRCEITKGYTGVGTCSGGKFDSLESYIQDMVKEHTYCYHFFRHGYSTANSLNR